MNSTGEGPAEAEGRITEVLSGNLFRVELDNHHLVQANISSKMWKHWVRLAVGDRVKMDMSLHDPDQARITERLACAAAVKK